MYVRTWVCLRLMLAVVVVSLVLSPLLGSSKAMAESEDVWSRVKRVSAYDAPRRARYPALTRTQRGMLVCLFTRQSEEQEAAGLGDIMAIYSRDRGNTWTEPVLVYQGTTGEPRTMGTLTTLASGKLVVALAEVGTEGEAELVCLLTSEDGGQSWEDSAPLELPGVESASPYGRLIERPDGTLLMPVFGVSAAEGQEGVQCVGLMRSSDGGQGWGDFSVIAADPEKSFTQPAVLPTGEDSLVALVNSDERLYRCESEDGGYHWSSPEQVLIGREPHLVRITDQALACVAARRPSDYGLMWVAFSYDNAKSWRGERTVMGYRATAAHWGWPSALALDAEHLLIALGRTQLHTPSLDGPAPRPISVEEERIEVVSFERDPQAPQLPLAEWIIPPAARDRWEYVESRQLDLPPVSFRTAQGELIGITGGQSLIWLSQGPDTKVVGGSGTAEELLRSSDGGRTWQRQPMNLPPGFRGDPSSLTQLSSGRLLCVIQEFLLGEWNDVDVNITGYRGGYALWDPDRKFVLKTRLYPVYSDDEGQTWQGTEHPIDISPLDWAYAGGRFIEQADGTVAMTVYGCLSEQDTSMRLDCCGLFRSTDGGQSWGDFSQIAYDKEHRETKYNEMDIAVVSDDLWVAFIRTEPHIYGDFHSWMSRAISTDRGYTWSAPELCFTHSVPSVEMLPDGGIVLGASGGVHFTYDLGRTWTREAPADGYPIPILLDEDTLLVSTWQNWGSFDVYRRIPAGPGGAE